MVQNLLEIHDPSLLVCFTLPSFKSLLRFWISVGGGEKKRTRPLEIFARPSASKPSIIDTQSWFPISCHFIERKTEPPANRYTVTPSAYRIKVMFFSRNRVLDMAANSFRDNPQ